MIKFPEGYVKVPYYPGYFWDTIAHKLYSIKIAGELREMKRHPAFKNHKVDAPVHYQLSYRGRRITYPLWKLVMLNYDKTKEETVDFKK